MVASIGLMVAAWVALAPISVDAPHADGRCGPPLVRIAAQEQVDDANEQVIIDRCEDAATGRLVLAGLAAGAGLVGFVVVRVVGRQRAHAARMRRRRARAEAERRAQEGQRSTVEARDAALRG